MPSYEQLLLDKYPDWLRGESGNRWGERWARGLGRYLDAAHAAVFVATRFRYDSHVADVTGTLAERGRDASICRYPGETDDAYHARIRARWTSKPWAGTGKGVLDELLAVGLDATRTLVGDAADAWTYVAGVLTRRDGFDVGEAGGNYSRIYVVTSGDPWGASHLFDDAGLVFDQADLYFGTSGSPEEVTAMKRAVWQSKSAHSLPWEWVVVHEGVVFDLPGVAFDDPGLLFDAPVSADSFPLSWGLFFDGWSPVVEADATGPVFFDDPGLVFGGVPAGVSCP